jgi:light-regulated signal transduction histidine kinase (bacteriophytochrome)
MMLASTPHAPKISAISRPVKANETALEDFVHSVAHELREPLRTIDMFSELLVRGANLDEDSRGQARLIIDGVRRMSSMLEGLYEFALSGTEPSEPALDLTRVVDEAILNLEHAVDAGHAVISVGPLPLVAGNEKELLRVVQNLIANAIKYRGDTPVEIHVTAEPRGAEWVVRVRDNGIGIAPEYQAQIFQVFQRLHGVGISGAGIGLAICKKVVEAMGGTIWVESKLGFGSAFCFTVAAAKPAAETVRLAAAAGL